MSFVTTMNRTEIRAALNRYLELRAVGRELHSKIAKAADKNSFNAIRVAKSMTLPVAGKTLLFEDELEMAAYHDFFLYEFRYNGKRALDEFDPSGLSQDETDLLEASRNSRTSLFEVTQADAKAGTVTLRDLLDPSRPEINFTDIQFSKSACRVRPVPLTFTRVLNIAEVNMSGGFFFPFDPSHATGLLQAYRQKTKRIPPSDLSRERFVFFYNKFRRIGSPAALEQSAM